MQDTPGILLAFALAFTYHTGVSFCPNTCLLFLLLFSSFREGDLLAQYACPPSRSQSLLGIKLCAINLSLNQNLDVHLQTQEYELSVRNLTLFFYLNYHICFEVLSISPTGQSAFIKMQLTGYRPLSHSTYPRV